MTRGFQAFILKVAPFFPLLVSALWLAGVASVWHSWLFCISPLQTFTTQNICPCQKCSSLNYWLFPQCFISWRGKSDAESAVTQHDWRYRCCSVPQLSVVCFTLLSVCCMYSHALCSDVNVCSCVCCVVMHVCLLELMWSVCVTRWLLKFVFSYKPFLRSSSSSKRRFLVEFYFVETRYYCIMCAQHH